MIIYKGYDCMKKILAICSIFFTLCTSFASCGNNDNDNDTDISSVTDNRIVDDEKNSSAGDYVDDALDGAEDAGEDLLDGITDAADDIVDGVDGSRNIND
mgnify:CR=1 FL=1